MTEGEKSLIERRRRKALRPAAEKKVCAEFEFLRMRSRGWHFTRFHGRVMKWERFGILVVLAVAAYFAATWLAKH
jgi:hypothetical protein